MAGVCERAYVIIKKALWKTGRKPNTPRTGVLSNINPLPNALTIFKMEAYRNSLIYKRLSNGSLVSVGNATA